MDLTKKTCKPCEGGVAPLAADEAKKLAPEIPKWKVSVEPPRVSREFKFKDFNEALKFTNRVGELAERENHHPDIFLAWGLVKLTLWTHSVGGLSENDFIFAAKVGSL